MTPIQLKKNIQKKLDSIDDSILKEVDIIINYISSEKEDYNELAEDVKQSIEEGLAQLDSGKKLSYDEVKKRNARWFQLVFSDQASANHS